MCFYIPIIMTENAAQNIFEYARTNDTEGLKNALQTVDLDATDARGSTPLIIAAYHNNLEAVELLLQSNAGRDLQDGMGNTALMGVCFKGYTKIGEVLLENGAGVNVVNGNNATALTFAATFGHNELIKILLAHGADKDLRDRFGKIPADYAGLQGNEEGFFLLTGRRE